MFGSKSKQTKTLPLQLAVLCIDCEVIAEAANDLCPVCGSRALIMLSRALGRLMGIERIARLDLEEDSPMRVVKNLVDSADVDGAPPVPA